MESGEGSIHVSYTSLETQALSSGSKKLAGALSAAAAGPASTCYMCWLVLFVGGIGAGNGCFS